MGTKLASTLPPGCKTSRLSARRIPTLSRISKVDQGFDKFHAQLDAGFAEIRARFAEVLARLPVSLVAQNQTLIGVPS